MQKCFVEMVFLYSSIIRIIWQYAAFWNKCGLFMLKLQIEFLNVNLQLSQLPVWMVPRPVPGLFAPKWDDSSHFLLSGTLRVTDSASDL